MLARPEWITASNLFVPPPRPEGWQRATALLRLWKERIGQRHALAMLNERDLRDIGVTRVEVMREVSKPFWSG